MSQIVGKSDSGMVIELAPSEPQLIPMYLVLDVDNVGAQSLCESHIPGFKASGDNINDHDFEISNMLYVIDIVTSEVSGLWGSFMVLRNLSFLTQATQDIVVTWLGEFVFGNI
jgi:hypothetical protein